MMREPDWSFKFTSGLSDDEGDRLSERESSTSTNTNQETTLDRIKRNDDTLEKLSIGQPSDKSYTSAGIDPADFSSLGLAIATNTQIKSLKVNIGDRSRSKYSIKWPSGKEELFEGIKQNSSIKEIVIFGGVYRKCYIVEGVGHELLQAYEGSNNLTDLRLSFCYLDNGGEHLISNLLRSCLNLNTVELSICNITDDHLLSIAEAIRGDTQLQKLSLSNNRIGNAGCETLATILQDSNCKLHTLDLHGNRFDSDGVIILAHSLIGNKTLREINLKNSIHGPYRKTTIDAFCKVLFNSSSINDIYSSNHALKQVYFKRRRDNGLQLTSLLQLNDRTNKSHVAIEKILHHYSDIDMTPLFELDVEGGERTLKALPYVVAWFQSAREATSYTWYDVDRRELSAIYQFAQAMPHLFVGK